MSTLTQDDKKRAVARKAIDFVPDDSIIGVGTGSTVNFFIDELARIKARIDGCVSSSDASTARLKAHGIPVGLERASESASLHLFDKIGNIQMERTLCRTIRDLLLKAIFKVF